MLPPAGPPAGSACPRPPLLSALDANADGEITADEIENAVAALKKLDKNTDGELASDELMPFGRGFGGPGGPMHHRARRRSSRNSTWTRMGSSKADERAEARKYVKENLPARRWPGRLWRTAGRIRRPWVWSAGAAPVSAAPGFGPPDGGGP